MLIKSTNNRNYNVRNFDDYDNVYAILVDNKSINMNKYVDDQLSTVVNIQFDHQVTLLIYGNDFVNDREYENVYKVVYGHFYNNQNEFIFKKLNNSEEIIDYSCQRCKKAELWHNKMEKLYFSKVYNEVKSAARVLNINDNKERRSQYTPQPISYIYDEITETIYAPTDITDEFKINYEEETLSFVNNNSKNIKIIT